MIVCHCNVIACTDIRLSVQRLATEHPANVITPGRVFRCCGALPRCGGCLSGVRRTIESELGKLATHGAAPPEPDAQPAAAGDDFGELMLLIDLRAGAAAG